MALLVEARYDKDAILQAYLNEIYLGQRGATAVHGVGEASLHYFGKSPDKLRLSESALIAAPVSLGLDMPFGQVWVAFAPGGVEGMAAMALALDFDPAYVAAHHLLRLLALALVLPLLMRGRRAG